MIAGLVRPDSGWVKIGGRALARDSDPIKRRIGLVPQDLALFDELTAQANLQLFSALYGLAGASAKNAIGEALALVGLSGRAHDRVSTYSGGMKRRLNLAAALLHDPQILLLDEPTVGVDPQSRNAIFDNLEVLKSRGKTLVYTTHYMEEAERLCDRVIIVDHGKVAADDTLAGLYGLLPAANLIVIELDEAPNGFPLDRLRALDGVHSAELTGATLRAGVQDLSAQTPCVLEWLVENGFRYHHVASERADLETVFLTLTGRSLRDT
jgi:ABC-2 type transport system ATP-binding protein